jgi:hypothetical protein
MLRRQRQIHQRPHRPLGAQQGIGQLELGIRPRAQAGVEPVAEPTQPGDRLDFGTLVLHAVHRGLRLIVITLGENQDLPKVAPRRGDTPTRAQNSPITSAEG